MTQPSAPTGLVILAVDDERPALDELAYLLEQDERVAHVVCCDSATEALRVLREEPPDAVFMDVAMPGLTGLELAEVLARFRVPPPIVFVTAHSEHAVDAFDLNAVDYLLKPIREERLREAIRRVCEGGGTAPDDTLPVELGGVTRFVSRSEVTYVEAQGDYARLHTATGSHLVRLPLSVLEERWGGAGFVRIHRSLLVALGRVEEVRVDGGRCTVLVGGRELQVSRRQSPVLRELLRRRRSSSSGTSGRTGERSTARRVRVTGPRGGRARPMTITSQIDAQTQVGEIYMRALMRTQLRLGLLVAAALGATVGAVPLLFWIWPGSSAVSILGIPLPWLVLGFGVYPVLLVLAWTYVRRAEANERAFHDLVNPR